MAAQPRACARVKTGVSLVQMLVVVATRALKTEAGERFHVAARCHVLIIFNIIM